MPYIPAADRYQSLPVARCGESGIVLPRICFGLWHYTGDTTSAANLRKVVFHAFDRGIFHFDAANNYGTPYGSAERYFGTLLAKELKAYRDELIISTKAGFDMWDGPFGRGGSRKYLLASLDQSLKRLNLDYVDIFYSHRFDPDVPLEETMGALASAVHAGKALYVGISNYDAAQTARACAILRQLGVRCLIHQGRYSLLDAASEPVLPTLIKEKAGFIAYSPLAQGLLSDRYLNGVPPRSRGMRGGESAVLSARREQNLPKLRAFAEIARARGQTLSQLAIAWLLAQKGVTAALTAASTPAQLDETLATFDAPALTAAECARIDRIRLGGGRLPSRGVVA